VKGKVIDWKEKVLFTFTSVVSCDSNWALCPYHLVPPFIMKELIKVNEKMSNFSDEETGNFLLGTH
jgi:hypothetical protein